MCCSRRHHQRHCRDDTVSYVGPARVTVKSLAALAVGSQGSFVTPISQTTVNVTFTH